jgi:hypothetical protein
MIVDVLDNVEKDDSVICFSELVGARVNVVAEEAAFATNCVSQRGFIEIEAIDFRAELVLKLALNEPAATANFRKFETSPIQRRRLHSQYFKAAADPKVIC